MSPDIASGGRSGLNHQHGALIEFANVERPLELQFEFNPSSMTRNRSVTVRTRRSPGSRGGYDFSGESEVHRVAQGVQVDPESLTLTILLDATDRLNTGDSNVQEKGVQPELDILRSMIEPKIQGQQGVRTLAALGHGSSRAISRQQYASVLLFRWGQQVLPVFMTRAEVEIKAWLPSLAPYRAEAILTLQVIESNNPFYRDEVQRQFASAEEFVSNSPRSTSPERR